MTQIKGEKKKKKKPLELEACPPKAPLKPSPSTFILVPPLLPSVRCHQRRAAGNRVHCSALVLALLRASVCCSSIHCFVLHASALIAALVRRRCRDKGRRRLPCSAGRSPFWFTLIFTIKFAPFPHLVILNLICNICFCAGK